MFRNLYRVLKINERGGVKMLWTPLKGFIDKKDLKKDVTIDKKN